MKNYILIGLRIFLGAMLLAFGINKFINIIGTFQLEGKALEVMQSLYSIDYMFPMVGIVEIMVGTLLVVGKYKALALVLLAPLSVNLILFHVATGDLGNILPALSVTIINVVLLIANKKAYAPLFQP